MIGPGYIAADGLDTIDTAGRAPARATVTRPLATVHDQARIPLERAHRWKTPCPFRRLTGYPPNDWIVFVPDYLLGDQPKAGD